MRSAVLLFCCFMSCDCAHVVDVRYTNISEKDLLEKINPLTWDIITDYGNGKVGACLGTPVFIHKQVMLLTAYHCVDRSPAEIYAKNIHEKPKKYRFFKIYRTNETFDLAILKPATKIEPFECSILSHTAPRRLDPYYHVKFETVHRTKVVFESGHITRIRSVINPLGSHMLSLPSPPGTSGGPIFNMYGYLVCLQTHAMHCSPWLDIFRWVLLVQKDQS